MTALRGQEKKREKKEREREREWKTKDWNEANFSWITYHQPWVGMYEYVYSYVVDVEDEPFFSLLFLANEMRGSPIESQY